MKIKELIEFLQILNELRFFDKQSIIHAAKEHGELPTPGSIARDPASRGVTSAYGIGFLDGAERAREELKKILNQ